MKRPYPINKVRWLSHEEAWEKILEAFGRSMPFNQQLRISIELGGDRHSRYTTETVEHIISQEKQLTAK